MGINIAVQFLWDNTLGIMDRLVCRVLMLYDLHTKFGCLFFFFYRRKFIPYFLFSFYFLVLSTKCKIKPTDTYKVSPQLVKNQNTVFV